MLYNQRFIDNKSHILNMNVAFYTALERQVYYFVDVHDLSSVLYSAIC